MIESRVVKNTYILSGYVHIIIYYESFRSCGCDWSHIRPPFRRQWRRFRPHRKWPHTAPDWTPLLSMLPTAKISNVNIQKLLFVLLLKIMEVFLIICSFLTQNRQWMSVWVLVCVLLQKQLFNSKIMRWQIQHKFKYLYYNPLPDIFLYMSIYIFMLNQYLIISSERALHWPGTENW